MDGWQDWDASLPAEPREAHFIGVIRAIGLVCAVYGFFMSGRFFAQGPLDYVPDPAVFFVGGWGLLGLSWLMRHMQVAQHHRQQVVARLQETHGAICTLACLLVDQSAPTPEPEAPTRKRFHVRRPR